MHERNEMSIFVRHQHPQYDDTHVSKQYELVHECHSSIGLRKWKNFVKFCENRPCE